MENKFVSLQCKLNGRSCQKVMDSTIGNHESNTKIRYQGMKCTTVDVVRVLEERQRQPLFSHINTYASSLI